MRGVFSAVNWDRVIRGEGESQDHEEAPPYWQGPEAGRGAGRKSPWDRGRGDQGAGSGPSSGSRIPSGRPAPSNNIVSLCCPAK